MGSGSDAEFVGVKDDGDRTVVGEPHAHVGAESSFFYFESLCAQGVVESVPCLFGVRGRSGFYEAWAVAFAHVRV